MPTYTTHGIKIVVQTKYEPAHSQPSQNKYIFSYRIVITNESDDTVQLLRRHWYIIDSCGIKREVKGDGVVGEQPVIDPGGSHTYVSWCPFESEIGMMKGHFVMERLLDEKEIEVRVPDFTMCAAPRLN